MRSRPRPGVHYWDDHGFGASSATVRVYVHSSLVFVAEDVVLVEGDMWEVATIAWPSAQVDLLQDADGEYRILSGYDAPGFAKE